MDRDAAGPLGRLPPAVHVLLHGLVHQNLLARNPVKAGTRFRLSATAKLYQRLLDFDPEDATSSGPDHNESVSLRDEKARLLSYEYLLRTSGKEEDAERLK